MSPVIELGELRHADDGDEPLPAPPRRPPGRTARAVALGVLLLLTLAGAAAPTRPPTPVRVPAPPGALFVVLAGRLMVADGPSALNQGGRVVTGYRLAGGAPAWRFALPAGDHVLGLTGAAGGLLVSSSPTGVGDARATLLDPATGAVRWRQAGYPVPTASGGVLFENPRPGGTGRVLAVDPASGAARWSLAVPPQGVAYRRDDRGVTQLVLVESDGRVAVHDADSGARVRAGRVSSAPDGVAYRYAQVVAGLLLVEGASDEVTAYGLDRLDRRWSVPVDPRAGSWFTDCAGMVCLRDQVGDAQALDPATGRPAWTDERWVGFGPVGGRLIAAEAGDGPELELTVLEPATGRVLGRLGRWRVSGRDDGSGRLLGLLGLRHLTGDRTLVGELDVAAGEARPRAVLPGSWAECADAGGALVCLRPAGGLAVWPAGR
ncbi:outer membrane protein assembly factor BamB family protein [Micromonospora schwarzwaldensis]|uniref:outer membrane protein assembly factor BamB family protein n=1 Tax=Micromonospora sp. DSM 45708 TaxID=3111767 RepID=UPI0031D2315B